MIEITKTQVPLSRMANMATGRTLCEADIIVPDVKPDIAKILQASAVPTVTGTTAGGEGVVVSGQVEINLTYLDESDKIFAITSRQSFSKTIETQIPEGDLIFDVQTPVESFEYNLSNSRKLNVKAMLCIELGITNSVEISLTSDMPDPDRYEVRKSRVTGYVANGADHEFIVKEAIEVPSNMPAIDEILRVSYSVFKRESQLAGDKAVGKGMLDVSIIFAGEDENRPIHHLSHEVSFTEVVNIDSPEEGASLDVEYVVKSLNYVLKEDAEGDYRHIIIEACVGMAVRVDHEVSCEILVDAYSPHAMVDPTFGEVRMDRLVSSLSHPLTIAESVAIGNDLPEATAICDVLAVPVLESSNIEHEKIMLQGSIVSHITYLSSKDAQNPICTTAITTPFSSVIDVSGAQDTMSSEVKLSVLRAGAGLTHGHEVGLRHNISADIRLIKSTNHEYIESMEEHEFPVVEGAKAHSVKIYFVQRGDTLWDIAKRYHVRLDDILAANNVGDGSEVFPGQQIIIPV